MADALGSPVAVTDNAGLVQTEFIYEAFGRTTAIGTSNSTSYQYTGRENDGTGLYYYRARFYNPVLQRFVSEDPIGFVAGDYNLYGYVQNNPVKHVDPSGLIKITLPDFGKVWEFVKCMAKCVTFEMTKGYGPYGLNDMLNDPGTWFNNLGSAINRCVEQCYPKAGLCKVHNIELDINWQRTAEGTARVMMTIGFITYVIASFVSG